MSDGQGWAYEMQQEQNQKPDDLSVLADEIQTMAGRLRQFIPRQGGCGVPRVVSEMNALARRVRAGQF